VTNSEPLEFDVHGALRVWPERRDLWTYFGMPDEITPRLNEIFERNPRGFRSIPVTARLGSESWRSALFRYRDGTWALPVRKDIRRRSSLKIGDIVHVHVSELPHAGSSA
jgi:hypothetical protein